MPHGVSRGGGNHGNGIGPPVGQKARSFHRVYGNVDLRGEFLARIAEVSVADLDQIGQTVVPKLVARVRPESRKLVSMHHEAGRETWIVSASPQGLVEPLAGALGMTGAIGTRGEVEDGRYPGRLDGL